MNATPTMKDNFIRFMTPHQEPVVIRKNLVFCGLLFFASPGLSDAIYKSTDRYGNVSYASTPAPNAVTVEIIAPPPEPSEEDVQRAEEALKAYRIQTEKERQEHQEREKERIKAENQRAKAYQPPPPPATERILYPYYADYPYYPGHKPWPLRHNLLRPGHKHHRHKPSLPDHKQSQPNHKALFPGHKPFQLHHKRRPLDRIGRPIEKPIPIPRPGRK